MPEETLGKSPNEAQSPRSTPPAPRSADGSPLYDLDIPWGEARFESFRSAYLSRDGLKWLAAVSERARPFMPYIAERIRFYGLPEELAFLPVIESEFSPKAVSKSGAAGLWQFMKNSISGYGIGIDDWVDERRDFMKSTDGALRKLADNYNSLGDWALALAAYNAGLGAVTRAVKKGEGADYWELSRRGLLPKETLSYVPKFLAAASILRYPTVYGLPAAWNPPANWKRISLGRSIDLGLLAEAAGISLEELRKANAELRYAVTPPYAGYGLKVPADSADAVQAVVNDPAQKLIRYYMHKVRSGDTLSALSRQYGTPQSMILDANPGLKADLIKLGQVLVVPALKEASLPPKETEASEGTVPDFSGSYLVAKGDTLWSISLKFEVQPELLAERNGLELGSVLREGARLRVPILE